MSLVGDPENGGTNGERTPVSAATPEQPVAGHPEVTAEGDRMRPSPPSSEIATVTPQFVGLLDVQTGELLTPSVGNAAKVLSAARAQKQLINEIVQEATAYLVALSEHQGTKTLHGEGETITLTGGTSVDYDPADLRDALEAAGCPEERINAAVETTITYKVNRSVLRQLAAANQDYKAAIELATIEVEKPYRASLKLRRNTDAE